MICSVTRATARARARREVVSDRASRRALPNPRSSRSNGSNGDDGGASRCPARGLVKKSRPATPQRRGDRDDERDDDDDDDDDRNEREVTREMC